MANTNDIGIVIFDEVSILRRRIYDLLQGYSISVYEASNDVELFNVLSEDMLNIRLVIMDITYDSHYGFEIISRIKEMNSDVSVIILTSNNKRQTFIRGIAEGVTDYILKPFEDYYLLEKVLTFINKIKQEDYEFAESKNQIVFDIQSYLNTELKKALKGKYDISVLLCTFFIPVSEISTKVENNYIQVSNLFYQKSKLVLWDTDVFERYGSQTFIGVFPYCGLENSEKIKSKIRDSFNELKETNMEVSKFNLAISSITFPLVRTDAKELLMSLGISMKKEIDEMKKNIEIYG